LDDYASGLGSLLTTENPSRALKGQVPIKAPVIKTVSEKRGGGFWSRLFGNKK
jgi:hypothetical protein